MGILEDIFKDYDPNNFDPIVWYEKTREVLFYKSRFDSFDEQVHQDVCNDYGFASNLFLNAGFPEYGISILNDGWNEFSNIQVKTKKRIYKAGIGMYLALAHLKLNDNGASIRWALLTQADDLLGKHSQGGGAGKQLLQSVFGMSNQAFMELKKIATNNLIEIEKDNDWSIPQAFPEDIITKFAYKKQDFAHLFAKDTKVTQFPLNNAYYSSLQKKAHGVANNSTEKGKNLEDVATYLFLLIPGLIPIRNCIDESDTHEFDIVIRNLTMNTNLITDLFGRHFLVECKNWENPIGVQEVGYFLYRMQLTHSNFGVIFASNGITGGKTQDKAANNSLHKAFHEIGKTCIVIKNEDLEKLSNYEKNFRSLLLERIEQLRFGSSKKTIDS
jgi:hypothetical protein